MKEDAYGNTKEASRPDASLQFSADALPRTTTVETRKLNQLQVLVKNYAEQDEKHKKELAEKRKDEQKRLDLEAQVKQLQDEIAAVKEANQATPDNPELIAWLAANDPRLGVEVTQTHINN